MKSLWSLFARISLCAAFFMGSVAQAATFTVSSLNNTGTGTLREAITLANASAGADLINFSVAGTIFITAALPGISDPVTIDGSTAPGYIACGRPFISLDGGGGGGNGIQLLTGATGSSLIALNVRNFQFNGIQLIGADNCIIQACYIGTNNAGTAAASNGQNGIQMESSPDGNTIGGNALCQGNLISGNNQTGINLIDGDNNIIAGNTIGLNSAGTAAIPNGGAGVNVFGNGFNNLIGGSVASAGNVISGNGTGLTGNGISLDGNSGCTIQGNLIGLSANGTTAIGNAENGIAINSAPNTVIGGTTRNERNVIADHNFHAIVLNNASNNSTIQGNYCGTNANGTAAFGNDDSGVIVINTSGVIIGGSVSGSGNLFSGSLSEYGIFLINADNTTVQGNNIGTDVTGTLGLPNFDGGIRVDFGSAQCTIGGAGAGEGNRIAFNTGYGVGVLSSADRQVLISQNEMFCNTGKGIELNGLGNNNHPSPVITGANASGVTGTASAGDIIEIFYDSLCTPPCQGKDYIATVTTNAAGNWSYTGPIVNGATLVATARAVAPPPGNANNTSEFSCFTILPVEGLVFSGNWISEEKVQLSWETQSEVNSDRFEVESSPDGVNFSRIGEVEASGYSSVPSSYTLLDRNPVGLFYRLKQVDVSGENSFSPIIQVLPFHSGGAVKVFPQPARDQLLFTIAETSEDPVRCRVFDLNGRLLQEKQLVPNGTGTWSLPVASFENGVYVLSLSLKGGTIRKKVTILH